MMVRDVSSLSTRLVAALGLACSVFGCEKEPEPVPIRNISRPAAAGGSPNAIQNANVPSTAATTAAGTANAGTRNAPTPGSFAASLGNIEAFTVAPNKFVKVPYTDELHDEAGQFDLPKHRFKAAKSQHYQVCASLASFSKDFTVSLYVNGTREGTFANSRNSAAQGCRTLFLKAGDLVELWTQHANDEPLAFAANDFWNWLNIYPVQGSASLTDIAEFTVPPNTFTKVPYGTPRYNIDKRFDVKTNRYVAATAGDYHICASLAAPTTEAEFELDLFINGNRENSIAASSRGVGSGCRSVRLAQDQTVEVWVNVSGAAPVKFDRSKFSHRLSIDKATNSEVPISVALDNINPFTAQGGAFSRVPYVNLIFCDQNQFDAQALKYRAATAGDHRICGSLASLTKNFELDLYVNGAREKGLAWGANGIAQGCRIVRLKRPGDLVEIFVQPTANEPLAFAMNQFWDWLTLEKL